jgi:hypothetical protein
LYATGSGCCTQSGGVCSFLVGCDTLCGVKASFLGIGLRAGVLKGGFGLPPCLLFCLPQSKNCAPQWQICTEWCCPFSSNTTRYKPLFQCGHAFCSAVSSFACNLFVLFNYAVFIHAVWYFSVHCFLFIARFLCTTRRFVVVTFFLLGIFFVTSSSF